MKPRVLVLGGCGFIGRNFVDYLIREGLVEEIRVVDKVPPQTAWLSETHKESFSDPKVQFKSANLINPDSCRAAFAREDNLAFDFAINCACETRPGQSDPIYAEGIFKLSVTCAKEAVHAGIRRYVEFSTGQIGNNAKAPHTEKDKRKPETNLAKWKARVEDELAEVKGLNYVIVRPAIVYGFGDRTGLMPLLIVGAIYKHLGESMKLLWSRDLKMNTVHVKDVCRAIWHVLNLSEASGQIYNIVDEGDSNLGLVSGLVSEIFGVDISYLGTTFSTLASVDLEAVAEEINDKHLGPWAAMCSSASIINTPLTPFLDSEAIRKNHVYLDGGKLLETGFTYSFPQLTANVLKEVLEDYAGRNLFPRSYFS